MIVWEFKPELNASKNKSRIMDFRILTGQSFYLRQNLSLISCIRKERNSFLGAKVHEGVSKV
jgi:hypothetical protein